MMKTIDKSCPKEYKAKLDQQGCPFCGALLIKERIIPFQPEGYYRCSWCQTYGTLREIRELKGAFA